MSSSRITEYLNALQTISGDKELMDKAAQSYKAVSGIFQGPEFVPPTIESSIKAIVGGFAGIFQAFTGDSGKIPTARNIVSDNQKTPPPTGPGITY